VQLLVFFRRISDTYRAKKIRAVQEFESGKWPSQLLIGDQFWNDAGEEGQRRKVSLSTLIDEDGQEQPYRS
jgi:hypothetical protein